MFTTYPKSKEKLKSENLSMGTLISHKFNEKNINLTQKRTRKNKILMININSKEGDKIEKKN